MMAETVNISLTSNVARGVLSLNPMREQWESKGKRGIQEFCFTHYVDHSQAAALSLFVKRLCREATGHRLLLGHMREPIPRTPPFLGYASSGSWHYYVYQRLEGAVDLDRIFENPRVLHRPFLTHESCGALLRAVSAVLESINTKGFYYTDLKYENILYHHRRKGYVLIDIDSCVPLTSTEQGQGVAFGQTYWSLFAANRLGIAARGASPSRYGEYLNQTMVMSLSLVLVNALATMLHDPTRRNVATVLRAYPKQQLQLFEIASRGSLRDFSNAFGTRPFTYSQMAVFTREWNSILNDMSAGLHVPWRRINALTEQLLTMTAH